MGNIYQELTGPNAGITPANLNETGIPTGLMTFLPGYEISTYDGETTGGTLTISAGEITSGITLSNATVPYQYMHVYGTAIDTTMRPGGELIIRSGGFASGTIMNSGASGLDAYSYQKVRDGGVVSSTYIYYKGSQLISGGTAIYTIIYSGGYQSILSGGVAHSTTVNLNGRQEINFGGMASGALVVGTQSILSGGVASSTRLFGGVQFISNGGIVRNTDIDYLGTQHVSSGGVASATILISGFQMIFSGGIASDATVYSAGHQWISSGGLAVNSVISGIQTLAGGSARNTTVGVNGRQSVSRSIVNDTIISGGEQDIYSGGDRPCNIYLLRGAAGGS